MAGPEDSSTEKVSIEMQAGPSQAAGKDNSRNNDEKPPNPPKRDYGIEKPEDQYARVQKRKTIGSFPRNYFIYKPERTGGGMSCLRVCLIVFNLFIWLLGTVITVLGIWIKSDEEFFKIQDGLDVTQFRTAGWILIFIGVIIMLIGFIGCYGVAKSKICFLIIFSIIVCIVIIMEIVVMALVWTAVSNKNVQEQVKLKAKTAMGQMMQDEGKRQFIDLLQSKLHCCGIDDANDYAIDPKSGLTVPRSCYDSETQLPYEIGCYQAIENYLKGKAAVVGGIAVAVFILQLGALVFTICLACGLKQAGNPLC